MPRHRKSEKLPEGLVGKVDSMPHSEISGKVYTISGFLSRYVTERPTVGNRKIPFFTAFDVEYTLKEGILTRTEFAIMETAIPVHMSHHDPKTGKRFSVVLDRFE